MKRGTIMWLALLYAKHDSSSTYSTGFDKVLLEPEKECKDIEFAVTLFIEGVYSFIAYFIHGFALIQ